MRKSRFTEEHIASIVTRAQAGVPIDELCRKYGISVQIFYRWRSKFADLTPSELRCTKEP
jgi:putative transposase